LSFILKDKSRRHLSLTMGIAMGCSGCQCTPRARKMEEGSI